FFLFTSHRACSSFTYTTLFRSPRAGPFLAGGGNREPAAGTAVLVSERPRRAHPRADRRGGWPGRGALRSGCARPAAAAGASRARDRKSTRLNSSHVKISYAVFC